MFAVLSPEKIMRLGMGFWGSKVLLSAVELGVFTALAEKPLTLSELISRLSLHPRGARDFFDALVALGMLERDNGNYRNTPETNAFLDKNKPSYLGGVLEMANLRLYGFWGKLTEALRTGKPQNEIRGAEGQWEAMYREPEIVESFAKAMRGASTFAAIEISQKFEWKSYTTFIDLGTAEGAFAVIIAETHAHLTGIGYDLQVLEPHFKAYVEASGLTDRLAFVGGDFFKDPLPPADVYVMGHILHLFGLEDKIKLVKKVYRALNPDGALIIYDAMIDDERKANAFGLLMSLNMLIESDSGFDYTASDCRGWLKATGLRDIRLQRLAGPDSMVVGYKH